VKPRKRTRKCFCTEPLRPDGTCRYGCDPALRAPAWRIGHVNQTLRRRERAAKNRYDFPTESEMLRCRAK
jgi:hypothetical protein